MKFIKIDLFSPLIFLYFFTLHADKLNVILGGYTIRINNALALVLIAFFLVRFRHHLFSFNKKLAYPLLAIAFSLTLSALYSPYKQRCFLYLGWYSVTLLCYVVLPYFLVKLWDVQKVFSLYCASFIGVGCYASLQLLLSFFGWHDPFTDQYVYGSFVRPNAFCFEPSFYALYMTPFVFMYNTYFLTEREGSFFIFHKKSLTQALLINLLYILSTSSAVFFAYVLFLVLAPFFPVINRKRLIHFTLTFCGALCTLLVTLPLLAKHVFMKFFFHGFMGHHSFFERWIGLINGWKIFLEHPVCGVGLGGYPCYLMEAYLKGSDRFTFLKMHALIGEFYNPVKLFEAMNVTTELLASLGLLGFCAFSWLFVLFFLYGKRIKNDSEKISALLISMIVTLVIIQFSQGLFRTYLWTHFTLAFAYFEKKSETYHESTSPYNRFAEL